MLALCIKLYKMLYQLPNGKAIEISTEQYLDMTDEDFEYLMAYNYGEIQEDPWFGSVITKAAPIDIPEEITPELTDLSQDEKLLDLDLDNDLLQE
jgi:hypothetical protein